MFSSVHPWTDGRVFHREAVALTDIADIELHAVADFEHRKVDGVDVYGVPLWQGPLDRIKSLWLLWKRIYKSDARVFHFHDPELLLLTPFIKLFKKGQVVFDVHEHYPMMMLEKEYIPLPLRKLISYVFSFIEQILLFFVDWVIYTTGHVGERYVARKGKQAFQVNNVPEIGLFAEEPPAWEERKKNVVFLGNMTPIRGIPQILEAFKIVHKEAPEYVLELYGHFYTPEYKQSIVELIEKTGLQDAIKLHGRYDYREMDKILYQSRIGMITYLTLPNNMACMPNKMFEYMGAGLGIIASDFDNYREVIVEHNAGLVVVPEDVEGIAAHMLTLIRNPEIAQTYSSNARKAFKEIFNWDIEKQHFLKTYREGILSGNSA